MEYHSALKSKEVLIRIMMINLKNIMKSLEKGNLQRQSRRVVAKGEGKEAMGSDCLMGFLLG